MNINIFYSLFDGINETDTFEPGLKKERKSIFEVDLSGFAIRKCLICHIASQFAN